MYIDGELLRRMSRLVDQRVKVDLNGVNGRSSESRERPEESK